MNERPVEERPHGISFEGEGRTKQSHKDECDINILMKNWARTGSPNFQNQATPQYGDYSNVDDYRTAVTKLRVAEAAFDNLPAAVRSRMENDPGKLIEFLGNEDNREEAIQLNLLEKGVSMPPPKEAPEPQIPVEKPE